MKISKLLCPILLLILLNGCTAASDVRNKAFIKEIGTDCTQTEQSISLRIFGDDKKVISGKGSTLLSAVGDCESSQSKNLFSGHLEVFASSPYNMGNNLLTLLSNNRISPSCYVMCVNENAAGFIEKKGGQLADSIKSSGRNGLIMPKTISGVLNDLLESDNMAAVPTQKGDKLTMAVITPNRIKGTLSEDESKGLCWLCGNVKDIYMPIEYDGNKTDFYIRKVNTRITAEKSGDKIAVAVEIKINGNSENNPQNHQKEKEKVSEVVSALCSKTIAKTVVGMKADLFGLEKVIEASGTADIENWAEIIPKLEFSYRVKIAQ